ncbi:uncharacterized protein LOC143429850 [Xylocopa sonorina]|uniref:uncharacterized protein LOC143429850 n=1 Tax=Xylocopa sonorina TaxID=1818115 RepID=UPI00403AD0EE
MSQLEPKYAIEVQDIFSNPLETQKYETLKAEQVLRLSFLQRIRRLLKQEEIGDRTPAQFLCHMRDLAGTTVSDEFLRPFWSVRHPAMARAFVTAQTDLLLNKLARTADQILDGTTQQVTSITPISTTDFGAPIFSNIGASKILLSNSRPETRFCSRRSSSKIATRNSSPVKLKHCWYHWKFGTSSTRYRSLCSFLSGIEEGCQ